MKIKMEELLKSFDKFEQEVAINPSDGNLLLFFDGLAEKVINNELSKEQMQAVVDRINNLRELFAHKKEELNKASVELLNKQQHISQYIKNYHYKDRQ